MAGFLVCQFPRSESCPGVRRDERDCNRALAELFLTHDKGVRLLQKKNRQQNKVRNTVVTVFAALLSFLAGVNLSSAAVGQQAVSPSPTLSSEVISPKASSPGAESASPGGLPPPNYQAEFTPLIATGKIDAAWDKGHLVGFGGGETKEPVTLYDKSGRLLFDTFITVPGAMKTFQHTAAPGSSEMVVVAVAAVSGDGAIADLIFEVDKNGVRRAIRTSPFRTEKLCVTDEGTVWAYGWERDATGGDRHGHHPMLREYSFEQGQLRTAIDRDSVRPAPGIPVQGRRGDELQLRCEANRVALFNAPNNELIEYDTTSNKLNRWSMPAVREEVSITGFALMDSGEAYVATLDRSGATVLTGIFHLRISSLGTVEWVPVTVIPVKPGWFRLLGSDGNSLVYARGVRSSTLFWSQVPH
jgi:hypothetical protein